MQLLAKLADYRRAFGNIGLLYAARSFISSTPVEIAFRPSGVPHPVHLRLKTSDLSTFLKIFVARDYDFPVSAAPEVIVDAGANVGLSSVWYANRYPGARIVAVEPEPSNFAILRKNVAPYSNIVPLRAALWSSSEELVVVDPGIGHWAFRTERPVGSSQPSTGTVPAVTVDRLMADLGITRIDLLKVDIEGAEKEVFADASAWIGRVNAIVVEIHDRMKPGCGRAVYGATAEFVHEVHRGENIFLARAGAAAR